LAININADVTTGLSDKLMHGSIDQSDNDALSHSFECGKKTYFLVVRAGHTKDLLDPLYKNLYIKSLKRDRKIIIYGSNKQLINNLYKKLFRYRKPSPYTGRGIRRKHIRVLRKIGKKDKQKGKLF